jgi:hypothetical protein
MKRSVSTGEGLRYPPSTKMKRTDEKENSEIEAPGT